MEKISHQTNISNNNTTSISTASTALSLLLTLSFSLFLVAAVFLLFYFSHYLPLRKSSSSQLPNILIHLPVSLFLPIHWEQADKPVNRGIYNSQQNTGRIYHPKRKHLHQVQTVSSSIIQNCYMVLTISRRNILKNAFPEIEPYYSTYCLVVVLNQ